MSVSEKNAAQRPLAKPAALDANTKVAVLCGGVGAAKFLAGLVKVVKPSNITAVINTGDDMVLHGLHISPDIDTCIYTLAEANNTATGWGLAGESFTAMQALAAYGGESWFSLGDKDLATHLFRSELLSRGASLTDVTKRIGERWGLNLKLLPMSEDPVATKVQISDGTELDFQDYFVKRRHADAVQAVRFVGIENARASSGVLQGLSEADVVIIAPSNPIVSIGPILALEQIRELLAQRRETVVAVSPIIGDRALKGPAAEMLHGAGVEVSAVGVAGFYADIADHLVFDIQDSHLLDRVAASGLNGHICDTIMTDSEVAADLALFCVEAGSQPAPASTKPQPAPASAGSQPAPASTGSQPAPAATKSSSVSGPHSGATPKGANPDSTKPHSPANASHTPPDPVLFAAKSKPAAAKGANYKGASLEIFAIEGIKEVEPGDDIAEILFETGAIENGDILVVTQKIISKAEGALETVDPDDPLSHKPIVERESKSVLRRRGNLIISETKHGFICANAGIDRSNVKSGVVALLPEDSDRSARRIRHALFGRHDLDVAIIISDTFGRPWRRGLTDVAIGSAGLKPIIDLRGTPDALGREMHVTEVAIVDELAAAADLVLGKTSGCPVAVIRNAPRNWFGSGSVVQNIVRSPQEDLFR